MNVQKFKHAFMIFGCIYLLDGISTLIAKDPAPYGFFGFPITKNQELFKQFITAFILFYAYWKLKHK